MPNARNIEKGNGSLAKGQGESGYNKGTIRSDVRYRKVSKPSRQRSRVRVSSSPPFLSKELTESAPFSRGHKKAQNRYRKRALAGQSSRLLHFLRAQERDHGILCIAFLRRYRLSVRIERHANRGVTQQFLHDFQFRPGRSKRRRIRVPAIPGPE